MVAGITTITAPNPILRRKLKSEGVITFYPDYIFVLTLNSLRCFMILEFFLPKLKLI